MEPVFNDIIPRTRAQRVCQNHNMQQSSRFLLQQQMMIFLLTAIAPFHLCYNFVLYFLCNRLPWKTRSLLRTLDCVSVQAVTINLSTQLRFITLIPHQAISSLSRSDSTKTSQLLTRRLDNSSTIMFRTDGLICVKRDTQERLVDLKTWNKVTFAKLRLSKSKRTSSMPVKRITEVQHITCSISNMIQQETDNRLLSMTRTAVFALWCEPRISMIRAMGPTISSQAQIETESRFLSMKDITQLRLLASRFCVHRTLVDRQLPKVLYQDSSDQEAMKMR